MLQEIDLATDRLTELTDELLDVTRLQAGQFALHPAPTNLVALVRRVVQRLQHHDEPSSDAADGASRALRPRTQTRQEGRTCRGTGDHCRILIPHASSKSC